MALAHLNSAGTQRESFARKNLRLELFILIDLWFFVNDIHSTFINISLPANLTFEHSLNNIVSWSGLNKILKFQATRFPVCITNIQNWWSPNDQQS